LKNTGIAANGQAEEGQELEGDTPEGDLGGPVEPASSSERDDGLLGQKRLEDLSEDDFSGSDEDPAQLEALALQLK